MRAILLLKKQFLHTAELPDHCPNTVMEKDVINSDFGGDAYQAFLSQ